MTSTANTRNIRKIQEMRTPNHHESCGGDNGLRSIKGRCLGYQNTSHRKTSWQRNTRYHRSCTADDLVQTGCLDTEATSVQINQIIATGVTILGFNQIQEDNLIDSNFLCYSKSVQVTPTVYYKSNAYQQSRMPASNGLKLLPSRLHYSHLLLPVFLSR